MKTYCPTCRSEAEGKVVKKKETFPVRDDSVEIVSSVLECKKCGTEIFDEDLDAKNVDAVYGVYRKRHKLLSPKRIKEIREQYGLSQRGLAQLLGWGEITIHRYESGSIQDEAHDRMLQLLEDPVNMRKIYEENKSRLPDRLRESLERSLAGQATGVVTGRLASQESSEVSEFTGYRQSDFEKMKNMILFVLERGGKIYRTKLNKLLWYMDFYHFKHYTVSISGTAYVRLPFGPVPDNYELFLCDMLRQGSIEEQEVVFDGDKDVSGELLKPKAAFDARLFTKSELASMAEVVRKFKNLTSRKIMEMSHEEVPFKKTKKNQRISYDLAKELSI